VTEIESGRRALLSLQGVTCAYGGLIAVDRVEFDLDSNEVLGIVGPNGAGKTSLLNAITGLQRVQSGSVILMGTEVTKFGPSKRAKLGISRSFQLIRLVSELTILENVMLGGHLRRRQRSSAANDPKGQRPSGEEKLKDEALEALERFDILEFAGSRPEELPAGIQRRAEFVRISMANSPIVLLDEPTAGMGPADVPRIGEFIRELLKRGSAVILVEHNLKFVREMCTRLIVMDRGQVIAQGTPTEALNDDRTREIYMGRRA